MAWLRFGGLEVVLATPWSPGVALAVGERLPERSPFVPAMRTKRLRIRRVSTSRRSAKRMPRCTSSTTHVRRASTVWSIRESEMATSSSLAPRANVCMREGVRGQWLDVEREG